MSPRPLALTGARLIDPAEGRDGPGWLLVKDGRIADLGAGEAASLPDEAERIDCSGAVLAPGLIDLRVKTGEPGAEHRETLESAAQAAAAGGVTTIVLQPDTDPPVDQPAMVDFLARRARDLNLVNVLTAGAATQGLRGERMAEIGLMAEAGAAYFTDADQVITDSQVLRRVLAYAGGFNALVAHRPADPWLTRGACATEGELAARMGLPGAPAAAERIGLERDLVLAELTGGRLLADQITTGAALEAVERALARGVEASVSVGIAHLCFNELDIGDYRTFFRLNPPLRAEDDRRALIEALRDGRIDVVTSAHTPAPAEDKRLPFSEALPGVVGLETLLSALVGLHHEEGVDLIDALRPVTCGPAELLGLPSGRLAEGAPADLVLFDPNAPRRFDAAQLRSRSKNSPFDGRTLQGVVRRTMVGGRIIHQA
ncbi:dihydroorotase [Brevundimonas sp. 2R-24]|uniref:Dihydroorotase n=1 Tax=Peiella sedimenti TaxID=3061083 RepID=A0ABT8SP51_9CAUL|nr:dihydroorotase [Caulobacteraceae bacterium XZ-24]